MIGHIAHWRLQDTLCKHHVVFSRTISINVNESYTTEISEYDLKVYLQTVYFKEKAIHKKL